VNTPSISFVIPVRDDAQRLRRCLARIGEVAYPRDRFEIIVVDNGSADGSDAVARAAGATVLRVVGVPVAELRNRGASAARGDILAFVDADHEVDRRWAATAAETLSTAGCGAAGALYHAPPDGTWVQRTYDLLRVRVPGCQDAEWLGSGNLAVRAAAFLHVGGFDRTLETCEDVDLCQRLRAAGYRVVTDDRLRSVHLGDPSTLRALFLSERWRGRDNLTIALRGPWSWRALPSIVIPVADLAGLVVAALGLLAAPMGGLRITAACLAAIAALSSLRAARMLGVGRSVGPLRVARAFAVAAVYDLARAVALVRPVSHHARQAAEAVVR
jgi:GT2 family glycosyltransferase